MAKAFFYVVYIERDKTVSYASVEKKMNLALDWYRINDSLWIIYSSRDEEMWYSRLLNFTKPDGSLFICRLQRHHHQGWMDKSFWEWLEEEPKKRAKKSSSS